MGEHCWEMCTMQIVAREIQDSKDESPWELNPGFSSALKEDWPVHVCVRKGLRRLPHNG